jgi:hypothetical protein
MKWPLEFHYAWLGAGAAWTVTSLLDREWWNAAIALLWVAAAGLNVWLGSKIRAANARLAAEGFCATRPIPGVHMPALLIDTFKKAGVL